MDGGAPDDKVRRMKLLLDTNVVLDFLLNRQPWANDAAAIWDAHQQGKLTAVIAAFSLPTIFYIARRHAGVPAAFRAIDVCLAGLEIVPVDVSVLVKARTLPGSDFED